MGLVLGSEMALTGDSRQMWNYVSMVHFYDSLAGGGGRLNSCQQKTLSIFVIGIIVLTLTDDFTIAS